MDYIANGPDQDLVLDEEHMVDMARAVLRAIAVLGPSVSSEQIKAMGQFEGRDIVAQYVMYVLYHCGFISADLVGPPGPYDVYEIRLAERGRRIVDAIYSGV